MTRALHLTESLVARTRRPAPEVDEVTAFGWTELTPARLAEVAESILAARPHDGLHVFAYGSLLWSPEFEPAAIRPATLDGWHRAFCIELTSWRATPDAPGLMMGLLPGGRCRGLVKTVPSDQHAPALQKLIRREIWFEELLSAWSWVTVTTPDGPLTALTFYAPPSPNGLRPDLTLPQAARMIARACGHVGSNAEYLRRTVLALGDHGIHDGALWRLQRLVAAEIDTIPAERPTP